MSEIKFACPHCHQHIACDSDYASLGIECPACGGSLVVPRLTNAGFSHPDVVIVAPTPSPKHIPAPPVQSPLAMTDEQWRKNYAEVTGDSSGESTAWLLAAIGTLVVAVILKVNGFGFWPVVGWLLLGCVVSGILIARSRDEGGSAGRQIFMVLMYVCATIVVLPAIAVGILFIGCAAL